MSLSLLRLSRLISRPASSNPNFIASCRFQQLRHLNLQEYQSKQILYENGLTVQRFKVVSNSTEAQQALLPEEFGQLPNTKWSGFQEDISDSEEFVIKAQVLAGGRGKGNFLKSGLSGGVILTKEAMDAISITNSMLNDYLVTKQTDNKGVLVEKVMIAEAVRLKKEFYLAMVLDRSYSGGPLLVASPFGGMDIEEAADKDKTAIRRFKLPLGIELDVETAQRIAYMAFDLNLNDTKIVNQIAEQIARLHKLFLKLDALQIEINPLGVTNRGEVYCVDAKINFDENARFRHKWWDELESMNRAELNSSDLEARKYNLNFIGLEGKIGCLVNGAGLAMATMDIIKLHGGEPANFLDVGGGASAEQITAALKIIGSDLKVRAIFVNIFGGIMRCDTVVQGIIEAQKSLNLNQPIVVRLEGTRVREAKELIASSQLNMLSCDDFDEAARVAVEMSNI